MTVETAVETAVDATSEADVEREHYLMAGQQHRDLVTRLYEGLKLLFRERSDRLVMSEVSTASPDGRWMIPDIAIVLGQPQAEHRSYRVGVNGPAPTIVLEVVSPNDTDDVNGNKLDRHLQLGTAEMWFLHLRTGGVQRFVVEDGRFVMAPVGPCDALEGVRFEVEDGRFDPRYGDGSPFPHAASAEAARAERLAARLRAAGIDPDVDVDTTDGEEPGAGERV